MVAGVFYYKTFSTAYYIHTQLSPTAVVLTTATSGVGWFWESSVIDFFYNAFHTPTPVAMATATRAWFGGSVVGILYYKSFFHSTNTQLSPTIAVLATATRWWIGGGNPLYDLFHTHNIISYHHHHRSGFISLIRFYVLATSKVILRRVATCDSATL